MRIAVGFSGGVDSSVAVLLLQKAGHDVIAVHFDQLGTGANPEITTVAKSLGVPFEVLNVQQEFETQVRTPFIKKLKEGKMPNPCILCNPAFKFGTFWNQVREKFGPEKMATGHFCRTKNGKLLVAKDTAQDQTYFLAGLSREQLENIIFPLGEMTKEEVRKIAKKQNLPNADKKTSTDVCFLQDERFEDFVAAHVPQEPGNIIEKETESILGTHSGLAQFTLGQRKNLGIGGIKDRPEAPWFVVEKRPETKELIVSQEETHLDQMKLSAADFHWIAGTPPAENFECTAKIRFRSPAVPCSVVVKDKFVHVHFKTPVRAVVAGQQVVLYDEGVCLGGGAIL